MNWQFTARLRQAFFLFNAVPHQKTAHTEYIHVIHRRFQLSMIISVYVTMFIYCAVCLCLAEGLPRTTYSRGVCIMQQFVSILQYLLDSR